MRTKWFVLLIAAFAVLTLSGCGSNGGSGGSDVGSGDPGEPGAVETVGITNCTKCHSAATKETDTWLTSNHGNPDASPGSSGPADESSSCKPCHNQLLDGQRMDQAFPAGIEIGESRNGIVYADTLRNVASCESCHGGGSAHRGIGPIPFPRPDWEQCVSCHDIADDGTRDQHAENWGMLASSVGASAHNNSDDLHASTTRCQRCHTAEGSVQLRQYTGDADVMHLMDDVAPIAAEEDLHAVTCAACHVPHKDSGRWEDFIVNDNDLAEGNWDPNNNGEADQFDFCTSCHTYYNQDGVLTSSGSEASGTAEFYHDGAWYRQITSTHYDDPATGYDQAINKLEGYNLRKTGSSPCFDCHGHELRTNTRRSRDTAEPGDNAADYGPTIFTDWASSRHGANLLEAKYAADPNGDRTAEVVDAVRTAGREDGVGHGWSWTHYDWDATNRQSCQRCHTSTGTSNYMQAPDSYSPADNDFSHLEGWVTGGTPSSGQNEMLYCWGCHEIPATGVLNNPGGIIENYGGDNVIVRYPDIINSNTCMTCHIGREIGQNIEVSNSDFNNTGFINSHYLAAGASVFAASGYEYPGMNYTNVSYYAHDSIGTQYETITHGSDLPLTDDDMGPCVGCHMTAEEGSHNYLPYEFNSDGSLAYITPVCAECHAGDYTLTAEVIEEEELGYEAALDVLDAALQKIGIFYAPGYPYFFNDLEDTSRGNGVRDWIKASVYPGGLNPQQAGKYTMGAAFNFNLAAHDPGGFAHNRFYYKRLLWDGIDWVDNYVMDNSVPAIISALQADGAISAEVAAEASAYLGSSRPGTGADDRAPIPGLDPIRNF